MKKLFDIAKKGFSTFSFWDYAIFKLCIASIGIILGAYFYVFFLKYIAFVWIIFIITWIYLISKIFNKN